jgi:hypothetical protein
MTSIGKWMNENPSWVIWVLSVAIPIGVFEIGESSTRISQWLINTATRILGIATTPEIGKSYKEEWSALLAELPGKLTKILLTTSMLIRAVPRLWWILAGQDIPANLVRSFMRKSTGWRRSRDSPKPGVEVARLDGCHVAFRSRRSDPSVIVFNNADFREFMVKAKNGEYDLDVLDSLAS